MKNEKLKIADFEGLMRGIVIEDEDENGEGALGIYIPKIMNSSSGATTSAKTKFHADSEVKSASASAEVEFMWIRRSTLFGGLEQFAIPEKGQVVYVYAEDNDPQKMFYLNISPVLDGEKPDFETLKLTQEYETYKKVEQIRNIVTLLKLPNGNVIGFDYNEDLNSFEISFGDDGHHFHFVENEDAQYIEVKTKEGDFIKLNSLNGDITGHANRDLGLDIERDSKLVTGRNLTLEVGGNTNIIVSGDSTITTSGNTNITSSGNTNIKGATVNIN